MALILPILRLWVLLLNIYTTFKAMRPPNQSQRSARNKTGPSARAMQLRKRELKSNLAIWVVWSVFSATENLLDPTVGLVTPFYAEFKCLILLSLLVARAHAAEAILLHIIHPLLRPYVPAVDDILASIHSLSDLLFLLFLLPFEYISFWWFKWRLGKGVQGDGDKPPTDHEGGGRSEAGERRVLRPRNALQRSRMIDAEKQARVVLQSIDDAQNRVRAHSQGQPVGSGAWNDGRGKRGRDPASDPTIVGLRTRKRNLGYASAEGPPHGIGSSMTGVHHINRTAMDALPPAPSLNPFPVLPIAPTTQPEMDLSKPLPVLPQPSVRANPLQYEVWHAPRTSIERPADFSGRPSPLYPPSITPRRSDPLPPPPRILNPPYLVTPTPRRVSIGATSSQHALDATDEANRRTSRTNQARALRTARSVEPPAPQEHGVEEQREAEDFFGRALEPSIQAAEMDMDTETLSTRDGSSANEEVIEVEEGGRTADYGPSTSVEKRGHGNRRKVVSKVKKGKAKASPLAESLRRSIRNRNDISPNVQTDEFGFTIRPTLNRLGNHAKVSSSALSSSSTVGFSKSKPLARTKPALRTGQGGSETESSDEESKKKRRRLDLRGEDSVPDTPEAIEVNETAKHGELESTAISGRSGGIKRDTGVQIVEAKALRKPKQPTELRPPRATRASVRRPVSATQLNSEGAGKRPKIV